MVFGWVFLERVSGSPSELPGSQRLLQCTFIDQSTSGGVDDDRAVSHSLDAFMV